MKDSFKEAPNLSHLKNKMGMKSKVKLTNWYDKKIYLEYY